VEVRKKNTKKKKKRDDLINAIGGRKRTVALYGGTECTGYMGFVLEHGGLDGAKTSLQGGTSLNVAERPCAQSPASSPGGERLSQGEKGTLSGEVIASRRRRKTGHDRGGGKIAISNNRVRKVEGTIHKKECSRSPMDTPLGLDQGEGLRPRHQAEPFR